MELLTGKCKEEFIKWVDPILSTYLYESDNDESYESSILIDIEMIWHNLPLSMKYGVYKQFFSENGIFMHIKDFQTSDNEIIHECNINESACGFRYDNLDESITQIVKIANKQFNDKNN